MRKNARRIVAAGLGALYIAAFALLPIMAATHSLTYTNAQDTTVQNKLVKNYNQRHCVRFNRNKGCNSAQLVTGGCTTINVCAAAGLRIGSNLCTEWLTEFTDSCVIFSENNAGQALWLKEVANQAIATELALRKAADAEDYCIAWEGVSNTAQNTFCTTAQPAGLGLANGCRPCLETATAP